MRGGWVRGKGVEDSEKEGIPLGKAKEKRGTRIRTKGVGRTAIFLFGKDERGKREGLRSHREVAREAEA